MLVFNNQLLTEEAQLFGFDIDNIIRFEHELVLTLDVLETGQLIANIKEEWLKDHSPMPPLL